MFERQREKEKETADMIRESVLNRAIDCRTRETILLSLHCSTRRNFVPRIFAHESAIVATHVKFEGEGTIL